MKTMILLGFFGDLWGILVQWMSLSSNAELAVIIVWVIFFSCFVYFMIDWGLNPNKYKDRQSH